MNTKTLCWILASALVALGVLGVSGCDRNEARVTTTTAEPSEAAETLEDWPVAEEPLVEREDVVASREDELARREIEVAGTERELAELLQQIEEQRLELETHQTEVTAVEQTTAVLDGRDQEDFDDFVDFDVEPAAPEPDPAPVARRIAVMLPAATSIEVELTDPLSSETSLPGDGLRATVLRDVVRDGYVVVPAGSKVLGTVLAVDHGKKIGGQARMDLGFERLDLPSGEIVDIRSLVTLSGQKQKKKDAATIGGSAAGGAILGRVLSKKKSKGTAIGAILGAAVGAAVASENKGDPVVVAPGTVAELFLESPVEVAVVVESTDAIAANR